MRIDLARALFAALFMSWQAHAAQFVIVNADFPNEGFNDPTPAAPVGGNAGTTLGEQRINVFLRAAEIWGKSLKSEQTIHVFAFFDNTMFCNATSATLGGAASAFSYANVPAAPGGKPLPPDTWYPVALAEKITHQDIVDDPTFPFEIFAIFNPDLGTPGCLPASPWYLGLDNNEAPNQIDFLAVVLHELAHGLGFSVQPTVASSGARVDGLPSVWEQFMLDTSTGKRWIEMTDAERAASARNTLNLVWAGQHGSNVVPSVLDFRTQVDVVAPSALGAHDAQAAAFGPPLRNGHDVAGPLVAPTDAGGASPIDGCEPLSGPGIAGTIVLVDRGTCTFTVKVKNAQNAGAIAAIVANNTSGLPAMGGADPTITIPSVGITQALGTALRGALPSVFVSIGLDSTTRAGTVANFPRLYTPSAFAQGSSVSHWDTTATPNLLMEPNINSDLVSRVRNPDDLTRNLFADIGW